jgi:predicted enzyme related to lactoylglutathione lyase
MAAAITHFEVHVDDIEKAKKFYGEVFDWTFTDAGMGEGMEYWLIGTGRTMGMNDQSAGIDGGLVKRVDAAADNKAAPNAFVCTIQVGDVEATVEKVRASGGETYTDKMDIPNVGLWYGVKDPAGNHLGILQSAAR